MIGDPLVHRRQLWREGLIRLIICQEIELLCRIIKPFLCGRDECTYCKPVMDVLLTEAPIRYHDSLNPLSDGDSGVSLNEILPFLPVHKRQMETDGFYTTFIFSSIRFFLYLPKA